MKQKFKQKLLQIKANKSGHHFNKGERVNVIKWDEGDGLYKCEHLDGRDYWWVEERDLQVITPTLTIKKLTKTRGEKTYHTWQFSVKNKISNHNFNSKQSRDKSLNNFIKYIQENDFKIVNK